MNDRNAVTDVPEDVEPVAELTGDAAPGPDERESVVSGDESDRDQEGGGPGDRDEGPVRRPLIRATLKHPEGTPPPPRQAPVFTMHQQERSGASSRGSRGNGRFGNGSGHPNKKKGSRDRSGQQASSKGNSTGGKNRSSRPDRGPQRDASGRRPSSRRDKGRSR